MNAPSPQGFIQSGSAFGLIALGTAGLAMTLLVAAVGLPLAGLEWWMWLLPLWSIGALALGYANRQRSAPMGRRWLGRVWLLLAVVPLITLLAIGRPLQRELADETAGAAQPAPAAR